MSSMLFCKDCDHLVTATDGSRCGKTKYFDLVTGDPSFLACEVSRHDEKYCGESGKWFHRRIET